MDDDRQELSVEIQRDGLDMDDLLLFEDFQAHRNINPSQMAGFLDRVIVGGIRGKHYPMDALPKLFEAVADALNREANPVDPLGKVSNSA